MSLLPNPWIIIGALVLLAASNAISYTAGQRHALASVAASNAKATIEVVKSRQGAEAAVNKLDEKALCLELGGGASCD